LIRPKNGKTESAENLKTRLFAEKPWQELQSVCFLMEVKYRKLDHDLRLFVETVPGKLF